MNSMFVLLTFWCVAGADTSGCNAVVTQAWFPTEETCQLHSVRVGAILHSRIEDDGNKIYNYISRCLPIERVVLGPVN